jgi:iron complex outermembrane receptor protein
MDLGVGVSNLSFAFNYTDTTVDNRNPEVINDKRVIQLEQNLPNTRFTLSFNHNQGPWNLLARVRHYGDYVEFSTDDGSARLDAEARILVDAEVGYNFNDMGTLILGIENMFDEYPTNQKNNADPYPAGLLYAETSPFGFNGGFYYLRAIWNFN